MNKIESKNKGFTIIEVLIVLAIAGLILLIVFLAVPALQRNSRNNARSADASKVLAAVSECLSNRNGQVTSCDAANGSEIVSNGGLDMTSLGQIDTIQVTNGTGGTVTDPNILRIAFGQSCDNNGAFVANTNNRAFAALYIKETGGAPTAVCIES